MDTAGAREVAQKHLKHATSPTEKVNAINRAIDELLAQHNYFVGCPVTNTPLRGVSVRDGFINYHIF